jgi:hypothetical protein
MPPLSRLDLPRIVEGIRDLYRTVENAPGDNWQAPPWLVEHCNSFGPRAPLELLTPGRPPNHGWVMAQAAQAVLWRLSPPYGGGTQSITDSQLELQTKAALVELWDLLQAHFFGHILAENAGEQVRTLVTLGKLLHQLEAASKSAGPIEDAALPGPQHKMSMPEWWQSQMPKTLGDLLQIVEGGERYVGGTPVQWRSTSLVMAPRRAGPLDVPGADRLDLYCDQHFEGTGLTAQNIRRLRVKLCKRRVCSPGEANALSLAEVMDILLQPESEQPTLAADAAPSDTNESGQTVVSDDCNATADPPGEMMTSDSNAPDPDVGHGHDQVAAEANRVEAPATDGPQGSPPALATVVEGHPPPAATVLDDISNSPMSAANIAKLLREEGRRGATNDAIEAWLRRYRKKYEFCFQLNDEPRRNEPRYLYHLTDVLRPLREQFKSDG